MTVGLEASRPLRWTCLRRGLCGFTTLGGDRGCVCRSWMELICWDTVSSCRKRSSYCSKERIQGKVRSLVRGRMARREQGCSQGYASSSTLEGWIPASGLLCVNVWATCTFPSVPGSGPIFIMLMYSQGNRHSEAGKLPPQGKWQRQDLNPGRLAPALVTLTSTPLCAVCDCLLSPY